jgi:hypothetical protein
MKHVILGVAVFACLLFTTGTSQAQYVYYSPGASFGVYTPTVSVSYARPYSYGPYYSYRPYVAPYTSYYYAYPYYRHRWGWYPDYRTYYPGAVYSPGPVYYPY